jgi:hypothetical protein
MDGKIEMPGGEYKVIVVPECKYMPLDTFKQLAALADAGATICFEESKAYDVPGWGDLEKRRADVREIYRVMGFNLSVTNSAVPVKFRYGQGLVVFGNRGQALHGAGIFREPITDTGLSFVRRSFAGGWNYFIANKGTNLFDKAVILSHGFQSVVLLDPMTGRSGVAPNQVGQDVPKQNLAMEDGKFRSNLKWVRLQLQPGESVILHVFADKIVQGPAWNYSRTNGQPVEITGNWNLKFSQGGPTLPADFQTTKLASWTTFPDTNAQSFAGTANYTITFDAPDSIGKCVLDLGDVRQSARVILNGKDYGMLIIPPFRVIVDNVKPTGNNLKIEVTNVSANRIRDLDRRGVPWKIFKDINVVNENYRPFDASQWPLTDSGLLGPVTLTAVSFQ